MKASAIAAAVLSFAGTAISVNAGNLTKPFFQSRLILPANFKPPQNFKNVNLVQNINLEKSAPRASVNVVIENSASTPQDEYFIPFTSRQMETIGGLEVRDKKDLDSAPFKVEAVEFDPDRQDQFYSILSDNTLTSLQRYTILPC
jgi:oligosaccharyltransferase complex subunit alpha (ribophorin I)